MGGGGRLPPLEILKSVFLLQMSSKTSVDEVFMHHFEKMSGSEGEDPTGELPLNPAGDFRPSDPLIARPCGRACDQSVTRFIRSIKTVE